MCSKLGLFFLCVLIFEDNERFVVWRCWCCPTLMMYVYDGNEPVAVMAATKSLDGKLKVPQTCN